MRGGRFSRFDTDYDELRIQYELASLMKDWAPSKREFFFSVILDPDIEVEKFVGFLGAEFSDKVDQSSEIVRMIESLRALPPSSRRRVVYSVQELIR
jgi:hypothetical protein